MLTSCCILSIGSELLEGSVLDTNAFFLSGRLSDMGITPACVRQVPDDNDEIIRVLKESASKYELVFTTGGLGPTFDDLTAQCVANAAGVRWKRNETAFDHMCQVLSKVRVAVDENHYRQASLPEGCELFHNSLGTALGFGVETNESYIISMPGVPAEMKGMFDGPVVEFLSKKFQFEKPFKKEVYIASISESDVDKFIIDTQIPEKTQCIINAGKGQVVVKLRGRNEKLIDDFSAKLAAAFPNNFIGYNGSSLPFALTLLLRELGKTIAVAESCTGGLIGKTITDIGGSSHVFTGGIISYSNRMKENVLGVKSQTLQNFGAVSFETAKEMAAGVIRVTGSDYGLSVTGIAGPDGGSVEKPVGTVFIGVASKTLADAKGFLMRGDRNEVRERSMNVAFYQMIKFIKEGI